MINIKNIIAYPLIFYTKFHIIQIIIIMFFVLLNMKNTKKNDDFITSLVKNVSYNTQISFYTKLNKIKKVECDEKKDVDHVYKLIKKYDYYYVIIDRKQTLCTFYSYNGDHFIFFPTTTVNVTLKSIEESKQKWLDEKINLYKYENSKLVPIRKRITVSQVFDYIKSIEFPQSNIINILSYCGGTPPSQIFVKQLSSSHNDLQIKNYMFEPLISPGTIICKYNIKNFIICNNSSLFLFYQYLFNNKKSEIIIFNINEHNLNKYFNSYCPLFSYFMLNHSINFLKRYKFNNIYGKMLLNLK
jgi:hypothetical protein